MDLAEIHNIKFPDVITRFDGDIEMGKPGWKMNVTPIQMLAEIIYAQANCESSDEVICTVGYIPSETREMRERLNAVNAKYGMEPRKYQGHQTVSLWRRQPKDPDDEDSYQINHSYVTFHFTLEPDNGLVEWWWAKFGEAYAD